MEAAEAIDPMEGIWLCRWSDALPTTRTNVDEMLTKKENWPGLVALTSFSSGAAGNRTRRSTRQYAV
jgi:hypothetical protein